MPQSKPFSVAAALAILNAVLPLFVPFVIGIGHYLHNHYGLNFPPDYLDNLRNAIVLVSNAYIGHKVANRVPEVMTTLDLKGAHNV